MQWHSFVQLLWGLQKELNYKFRHSWKGCKKPPCFQFLMHVMTAFIAENVQCWLWSKTLQSWFHNKFNMQVLHMFYQAIKLVEIFLLKTWVNLVFTMVAVTLSASWTETAVMKPLHQPHQKTGFSPLLNQCTQKPAIISPQIKITAQEQTLLELKESREQVRFFTPELK